MLRHIPPDGHAPLRSVARPGYEEIQQNARDIANALHVSTSRHLKHPTPASEAELRELMDYVQQEQEQFRRAGLDDEDSVLLIKALAEAISAL